MAQLVWYILFQKSPYQGGGTCDPPEVCDRGWPDEYHDFTGNQAYHFWFFAATAYFDGTGLAYCGNFLHDGSETGLGQALLNMPVGGTLFASGEDLTELWDRNFPDYEFIRGDNSGASTEDYNLSLEGIDLGSRLKLGNFNQCEPGVCAVNFWWGLKPSDVPDWLEEHFPTEGNIK